jgi:subtilisin-like proprotein convertase family protein/subtilisin family serine protease
VSVCSYYRSIAVLLVIFILAGCQNEDDVSSTSNVTSTGSVSSASNIATPSVLPSQSAITPSFVAEVVDPFIQFAWHLKNSGQTTFAKYPGTAGNDINMSQTVLDGYSGSGIKILVSDSGVESSHEDLAANFIFGVSRDYIAQASSSPSPGVSKYESRSAEPASVNDNHGTAVAGIIGAVRGNGKGSSGVAFKAKIAATNFMSDQLTIRYLDMYIDQANGDFDVFNQSFGESQDVLTALEPLYLETLKFGVTKLRGGKGAIYVRSAGNGFVLKLKFTDQSGNRKTLFYRTGNANFNEYNTTPYKIIVGALNANGMSSSYSSPGSNLWISAPGGEFGDDDPAILTIDRMGCALGYSKTGSTKNIFESGQSGNSECNYTSAFNGTSSAAPMVSGVVALILEANSALTWRDVKHILASTATQVDADIPDIKNYPIAFTDTSSPVASLPQGYVWEQKWIENVAGYKFHNWYGFGRVNVDAAVKMAKSYNLDLGIQSETKDGDGSWIYNSGVLQNEIPDNSAEGTTHTITVNHNFRIEAVQVQVSATHEDIGQIGIELTSPGKTKSILVNVNNALMGLSNYNGETLLSNAFYGESSKGDWTLRVIDGEQDVVGTLTNWKINFIGVDLGSSD